MTGRTVRQVIHDNTMPVRYGDRLAKQLGIDPDTDLDTHVLVAMPKCPSCQGSGHIRRPCLYTIRCQTCDGRGW